MKATITIHDILATYAKFAAGELFYTNRRDKFFSEFICHVIGEMLVVPGMKVSVGGITQSLTFGDIRGIDDQFKIQWCEKVIGIEPRNSGVMELWNEGTEYSREHFKLPDDNNMIFSRRVKYRMACLHKAAKQFPNLTFTFTNYLPQSDDY